MHLALTPLRVWSEPCTVRSKPILLFSIRVIQFGCVDTKQADLDFCDRNRVTIHNVGGTMQDRPRGYLGPGFRIIWLMFSRSLSGISCLLRCRLPARPGFTTGNYDKYYDRANEE